MRYSSPMVRFVSNKAEMRTYLENRFQIPPISPLAKGGKGGFIGGASS
jgi:hypothetical protein